MKILYVKSSSKKKSPTKQQVADHAAWLKQINDIKPPSYGKAKRIASVEAYKPAQSYVRETPKIASLNSHVIDNGTKPIHGKVYTGTKMIGIGTLHKSNAVPIFCNEDAKDQANMRR
jgi:hypothetical protein